MPSWSVSNLVKRRLKSVDLGMRWWCLPLLTLPISAQDAQAQAVLNKHLRLRGGIERLKALKSIRMRGWQLLLPSEAGIPWRMEQARPNRFREEITVQGMVEVHTFNGSEGWVLIPWGKDRAPKAMPQEQVDYLKEGAFDDPWIAALEHPQDLHFRGASRFNGVAVWEVQWSLGAGDDLIGQFDQATGLEIMRERVHREMDNEIKIRTESQLWQTVNGIAFPYIVTRRAVGRGGRVKVQLEAIELDPVLPESRFGRP